MPKIVSIHSFRGGTGKSNVTASLASLLAASGKRVAVVDTDIQSPGIHVLFQIRDDQVEKTLNDYLWERCEIREAALTVPMAALEGRLSLVPSSLKTSDIARVLKEGYDVTLLNEGFRDLLRDLELDYLFIDTHPGLNEETLLSLAISDVLIVIMRPDSQDYQGTGVTVEVARRLDVPELYVLVNKSPAAFPADEVKRKVESTYDCPVVAVLPHSDAMMQLSSAGVFALEFPDDPVTRALASVANKISGG